jgi:riboflavin biosynthesis pyrimidine reductase
MTATAWLPAVTEPGPAGPLDPGWSVEALWRPASDSSDGEARGGVLPADLGARYGAPLSIPLRVDRPTIVANFVSTLDGVVALDRIGSSGGREISGGFEPDRFVMGLLRATSDAVLVGAGTVRASRTNSWTPSDVHPASASAFATWRRELGLVAAAPTTVIVTTSGALEARHIPSDPETPVILATTGSGARRLRRLPLAPHVEIAALSEADSIPIGPLVSFLDGHGFRLVVSEGGPSVFGELLAARVVDEIFLTIAPQLAGRSTASERLSLVEHVALTPAAPWGRLQSVMRSNNHLFLRYRLSDPNREDPS